MFAAAVPRSSRETVARLRLSRVQHGVGIGSIDGRGIGLSQMSDTADS